MRVLWLHGDSGSDTECCCGGGEREDARTGEDESGDEKVGRWWALPWPRPKEKLGGVWGIMAYMAIVELRWNLE